MAHREYLLIHGSRAWSRIKATAAEQRELWRDVGEALLVGRKLHKADQKFSQWCKEMGFDMRPQVRSDVMWWASEGYTACKPLVRSDAMWLAEHWSSLQHSDATAGLTHPRRIKEWYEVYSDCKPPADMSHPRYRSAAIWLAQNWEASRSVTPGSSDPIQVQKEFNEQKQTALLPADLSDIQAESIETIVLDERSAEKVGKLSSRAKAGDEGSAIAQRHIEALAKKHNTTPE